MSDPKDVPAASPWATSKTKPRLNYGAKDPLTKAMAVSFIINQLKPNPAERRPVSDKVRKRVTSALEGGQLRSNNGVMLFGDLILLC